MSSPSALVIPALKRHTATVIVAHGLGDSGFGWSWLAENWRRRAKFEEVSFIFPHAPQIPITINMGMRMPGWYDILSLSDLDGRQEDEQGIMRSRTVLQGLIDAEIEKGIPAERIVLGGFSQGGAMSLVAGLSYKRKLGGIFGLSCWLLLQGNSKYMDLVKETSNANEKTKVFMGHGDADQVVQYKWGQKTAEILKKEGWDVDFRTYRYVHPLTNFYKGVSC